MERDLCNALHETIVGRRTDVPNDCENRDVLHLGLSENSVPLHPMVNDQLSLLNGYNWGYTLFSDKPI